MCSAWGAQLHPQRVLIGGGVLPGHATTRARVPIGRRPQGGGCPTDQCPQGCVAEQGRRCLPSPRSHSPAALQLESRVTSGSPPPCHPPLLSPRCHCHLMGTRWPPPQGCTCALHACSDSHLQHVRTCKQPQLHVCSCVYTCLHMRVFARAFSVPSMHTRV